MVARSAASAAIYEDGVVGQSEVECSTSLWWPRSYMPMYGGVGCMLRRLHDIDWRRAIEVKSIRAVMEKAVESRTG
jgi:hypothetical protein